MNEDAFKSIDKLNDKFNKNIKIGINEACFILYAEKWVPSSRYLKFREWVREQNLHRRKWVFNIWYHLYLGWFEENQAFI